VKQLLKERRRDDNEKMPTKGSFVLDTSALLALRGAEAGADRVEMLLSQAKKNQCRLLAFFMTRMEVLYIVWQEEGEEAARHALRLMDSFAVGWVSCEPTILEIAARIKARSISKKRFPNSLFCFVNRIVSLKRHGCLQCSKKTIERTTKVTLSH
jgi:predicted nucleic acid-binding protein